MLPIYNGIGILADNPASPLSGNKGFKLKPYIDGAIDDKRGGLIGFGSAYSNFLLSLALNCHQVGLQSIGIVCGDEQAARALNPVLSIAKACGMRFQFVSRQEYRLRHSADYANALVEKYPGFSIVPEGGSSSEAAVNCGELIQGYRDNSYSNTHWLIAAGTGATGAGVAAAMLPTQRAFVVSVTNDAEVPANIRTLAQSICAQQSEQSTTEQQPDCVLDQRLNIVSAVRPPRFGKLDRDLCFIVSECHEATGILLDPVYTVRVLQTYDQLRKQESAYDGAPVLVHTGGLSGWLAQPETLNGWLSKSTMQAIERLHDCYHQLPDNCGDIDFAAGDTDV